MSKASLPYVVLPVNFKSCTYVKACSTILLFQRSCDNAGNQIDQTHILHMPSEQPDWRIIFDVRHLSPPGLAT